VSVIWRKPVLTYAFSVVSLTASVNSVNMFYYPKYVINVINEKKNRNTLTIEENSNAKIMNTKL